MIINSEDKKVNIRIPDLVFVACRKRERFKRFDNALKDDPSFAISVVEREETKAGNSYYPNIVLNCSFKMCSVPIELSGSASVCIKGGTYTLDVIKSVRYPIKLVDEAFIDDWHSEAKILAFILAQKKTLENVNVRVLVFHTETLERKCFNFSYTYEQLTEEFKTTAGIFSKMLDMNIGHINERNSKNQSAGFPFENSRDGQKDIGKEIYSAIKNKHNIIINAPTGLGKTVATIYPSVKAQAKGLCDKVFYLTAKGSGSDSVKNAVDVFEKAGYELRVSYLSAKYKICSKRPCSPSNCNYPRGHHGRVMEAVTEMVTKFKAFTSENVKEYAEKYKVCPFMLETELVWFADLVVCDYNYIFDPKVSVKISSCLSGNDVILVDEAHNLADRLRNIYSATVNIDTIKTLCEKTDSTSNLNKSLKSFLKFVENDTEDSGFACESLSSQSLDGLEREMNSLYSDLQESYEECREKEQSVTALLDSLKEFIDLITLRNDDYITFYNDKGYPEIFLVNTSTTLYKMSKSLGSAVMFSATLFPEEYYKFMLGARSGDSYVSIPSPFDARNLLVLCYPLSTRYSEREQTVEDVVRAIWTAGSTRAGNYIAFFPSYQYMLLALNTFIRLFPDEKVIYQKPDMTDEEKMSYVDSFKSDNSNSLFAFAVLGGAFSEGIDLVGDKLSGAAVVGLGSLPPSRKSALVSEYFNDMFFDGEKFAYHYPGLNKVFQAGGRVIRSETDRGYLLIIDDRFLTEDNIELLPENWSNVKKVKDNNDIKEKICDFWQN